MYEGRKGSNYGKIDTSYRIFFCKKYQREPQKEKKMKKVKALCNNHRGVPDNSVVNNPPAVQEIQETGV